MGRIRWVSEGDGPSHLGRGWFVPLGLTDADLVGKGVGAEETEVGVALENDALFVGHPHVEALNEHAA